MYKCEEALAKGFLSVPSISLCVSRYPVILAKVAKVARHDCAWAFGLIRPEATQDIFFIHAMSSTWGKT